MNTSRGKLGVLVRTFPKISETFILAEVLGLERAGFEVTVFTLAPQPDCIVQPNAAHVRAEIVCLQRVPGEACTDAEYVQALARELKRRQIHHLHAHFIDRVASIGLNAAAAADATCSLEAHAKDIYLSDPTEITERLGRARFTVTCTAYNRAELLALAPEDASVHLVYHGIDSRSFAPVGASWKPPVAGAANAGHILAVGRLREKKGFATLLRACALLRDQGLDVNCDIIGYGEQQAELETLAHELGIRDRLRLHGKMNHTQVKRFLQSADVFAAPSEIAADGDRDGIPNVLLEAMASALPVVTTPVSGIPELVTTDRNGLLVPPSDPRSLAAALRRLLESPALRRQLGVAARATVEQRFGAEQNLRTLIDLLTPYTTAELSARRPQVAGIGSSLTAHGHA